MSWNWRSKLGSPAFSIALPLLAAALLSVRLLVFVDRQAVNILYWDQWDFWEGMFRGDSLWTLFRWQHGPHRQGLGYLVIAAVARLSGWSARAEAFAIGGLLVVATGLGLALARRLRGAWSPFDAAVPLIVLTLSQYEVVIGTLNPAHGVVPLVCVLAFAWALQIERPAVRLPVLLTVGVLTTYTGFGFFLGLVALAVFCVYLVGAVRKREAVVLHATFLVLSIVGLASFFWGYSLNTGTGRTLPTVGRVLDYLRYLSVLFLRPFELQGDGFPEVVLGPLLVIGAFALVAWSGWRSLRSGGSSTFHLTLFSLGGFALLFGVNAAIGRTELGAGQARSSRYLPCTIPMVLAAYLYLSLGSLSARWRSGLLVMALAALLAKEVSAPIQNADVIRSLTEGKRRWKECFLRENDVARCDAAAHFQIYPAADAIRWKLAALRERHLNLFAP